jgi:predicted RND superfamily exporter protein
VAYANSKRQNIEACNMYLRTVMAPLAFLGIVLNFASALVLIVPLISVYRKGRPKLKTSAIIQDIAATKFDINQALADELFLSRKCGVLALILLILGNSLLLWPS